MIYTPHRTPKPLNAIVRASLIILMVATCSFARTAHAQIPAAAKSAAQPPADAIHTHLQNAIKLLMSDLPSEQSHGRDLIVNEVTSAPSPSASFMFAYANELNNQIGPALASSNLRVRVNAAIAVARVAEKSAAPQLVPAVLTTLNDQHEAVSLWGLKAARWLIVPAGANSGRLISAVVATGTKHPANADAAYSALQNSNPSGPMIQTVITAIQDLMAARLAKYATGLPGEPIADATGASSLSESAWWKTLNKATKTRSAQLLSDLVAFAAQRLPTATPEIQEQLKVVIQRAGRGLVANAISDNFPDLNARLASVGSITPRTPVPSVTQAAAQVYPEIKKVWADVKAPATVQGGTPLPATTQPAGGT